MYEADDGLGGVVGRVTHAITNSVGEESDLIPFRYQDPPLRASVGLSFRVVCEEKYYGPSCSQFCFQDNCACDPGYTGEFCHEIDNCLEVNCSGNDECLDQKDNYTCICDPGYTEINCNMNIDECKTMSVNCNERGHCLDGINSFMCRCDPGFTGDLVGMEYVWMV